MTRRERAEMRLERRREWAASRRAKAAERFAQGEPYRGDIAFCTQPGHIPERARVIRATEKGVEHLNMADHHESKADGIERQLANTIFSDDENAIEALQAKIAKAEEKREMMKTANRIVRKHKKDTAAGVQALVSALGVSEATAAKLFEPDFCGRIGFPSYALTNLGANIRRMKGRIADIERQQTRQAEAEAAPGGVTITGERYVNVRFAEKPERDILQALKAAGFRWRGGCWQGYREQLPECVSELVA